MPRIRGRASRGPHLRPRPPRLAVDAPDAGAAARGSRPDARPDRECLVSLTARRVGRVLFGLAGAGSALFVHFLPSPADRGADAPARGVPAAVGSAESVTAPAAPTGTGPDASIAPSPPPADRPLVAMPPGGPHGGTESAEPPPAPALIATDGGAAHPPAAAARRR